MHDDGDKGHGGNEERYNDSAVFRPVPGQDFTYTTTVITTVG